MYEKFDVPGENNIYPWKLESTLTKCNSNLVHNRQNFLTLQNSLSTILHIIDTKHNQISCNKYIPGKSQECS